MRLMEITRYRSQQNIKTRWRERHSRIFVLVCSPENVVSWIILLALDKPRARKDKNTLRKRSGNSFSRSQMGTTIPRLVGGTRFAERIEGRSNNSNSFLRVARGNHERALSMVAGNVPETISAGLNERNLQPVDANGRATGAVLRLRRLANAVSYNPSPEINSIGGRARIEEEEEEEEVEEEEEEEE
ncbi:hypothetical protein V1477_004867 [Vespula maculifrons]|uniref:Uncharacterized protein n=1 Tax=Vespula maculifrons TaxID=7453 RepID=A0ABD2CN37_VESMC